MKTKKYHFANSSRQIYRIGGGEPPRYVRCNFTGAMAAAEDAGEPLYFLPLDEQRNLRKAARQGKIKIENLPSVAPKVDPVFGGTLAEIELGFEFEGD